MRSKRDSQWEVRDVSCFFVSLCAVYQIVPSESMRIDRVLSPSTGRVVCALPVSHIVIG